MPGASAQPLRQDWSRRRFFFSGTPYGDFDEVPAEASAGYLKQYSLLAHLGWNTMIDEDYNKLREFVSDGGTLLIGLPQFSRHTRREFLLEMNDLNLYCGGDLREFCGVRVKGEGQQFSGSWKVMDDALFPSREPVLSAWPSNHSGEDGACCLAYLELAGAEVVAVDAASGAPLLTRHRYGRGQVYLLCTYAYFGHEALQQFSANTLAALAEQSLPDFAVQSDGEIFWNVWDEGDGVKRVHLLNTDWTTAGNEVTAVICGQGLSVPVTVRERELLTATWVNGCLVIPDSPNMFVEVTGHDLAFHGDGYHSVRICRPGVPEANLQVDLTVSTVCKVRI